VDRRKKTTAPKAQDKLFYSDGRRLARGLAKATTKMSRRAGCPVHAGWAEPSPRCAPEDIQPASGQFERAPEYLEQQFWELALNIRQVYGAMDESATSEDLKGFSAASFPPSLVPATILESSSMRVKEQPRQARTTRQSIDKIRSGVNQMIRAAIQHAE